MWACGNYSRDSPQFFCARKKKSKNFTIGSEYTNWVSVTKSDRALVPYFIVYLFVKYYCVLFMNPNRHTLTYTIYFPFAHSDENTFKLNGEFRSKIVESTCARSETTITHSIYLQHFRTEFMLNACARSIVWLDHIEKRVCMYYT